MAKNLFYSFREKNLFESMNKELLGEILQMEIYYYAVDNKNTSNNIYGESDSKIYKQPIKFWALVEYNRPQTTNENFQSELDYSISIKFLRKYLEEADREVRLGDFIQFGNVIYEIYSIEQAKLIVGQPTEPWDMIAECKSTRYNVSDLKLSPL